MRWNPLSQIVVGSALMASPVAAQEPVDPALVDILQTQAQTPQPATRPTPQPATRPGTTAPISAGNPLSGTGAAPSGTSIRTSSFPMMMGDFQSPFAFSPYLVGTQPNGQRITLLPGQSATFPTGTVFNQPVSAFSVLTVPNPLDIRGGQPGLPAKVPPFITVVQPNASGLATGQPSATDVLVRGGSPIAHAGAIPVNVARGSFKIGENESPRPTDRIYATYNFFYDVNNSLRVPGTAITNVHRQTLGFEKTFLEGDASIGFRLPLVQIGGPANINSQSVGDLSIILKFAWINEPVQEVNGYRTGGNVLSTGVVLTTPTGGKTVFSAQDPNIHPTVIQPFVGGIRTLGNAYVLGFSSIAVPTDSRDTTFLFNDLQVGYQLYQDRTGTRFLRSITPIAEVHVNTPLNNRGIRCLPIGMSDIVSFTTGTTLGLGQRSYLNLGTNVPVTGPRPYGVEALIQFNWQY